jgi:hypothetical protein
MIFGKPGRHRHWNVMLVGVWLSKKERWPQDAHKTSAERCLLSCKTMPPAKHHARLVQGNHQALHAMRHFSPACMSLPTAVFARL